MAGRAPSSLGANQNRVFIDLTNDIELGNSELVSACARSPLREPTTFPPTPLCHSLFGQITFFLKPTIYLAINGNPVLRT